MKSKNTNYILFPILLLMSCVQKTHLKTIYFKLDMTAIESPSFVGARGEFGSNPWGETIYFSDIDADGIYEGTLTKQTGQNGINFKFVNHHNEYELQDQDNRYIPFKYQKEVIAYIATFNDPKEKIVLLNSVKE